MPTDPPTPPPCPTCGSEMETRETADESRTYLLCPNCRTTRPLGWTGDAPPPPPAVPVPEGRPAGDGRVATDHDHRIIDGISVAMAGRIGRTDDADRLLAALAVPPPARAERERALADIAVAFIRWAQDLKRRAEVRS